MNIEAELKLLSNVKVLVVDDELDILEAWRLILKQNGAEVKVADSVAQALDILDSWYPDILISDLSMPGESGYSLISEVRQKPVMRNLPAIAVSGVVDTPSTAINLGFSLFIRKPVGPEELVREITNLILNS